MKWIHLSDLHLGKRVNGFSMVEDQAYILKEILEIVRREEPQGVLIAGDVYDKTVPSAEAVGMLDDFLVSLSRLGPQVFLISGNHDSPERLAFGGRLMEQSGVHLAPVYDGNSCRFTLQDAHGPVDVFLLPFLKPVHVRRFFPEETIESYTDALRVAIDHLGVEEGRRNVLVTHQFVTGAARCESEELSVGGSDNVDASVFAPFDYVALGHIHGPQQVGKATIRYCGTPLKYSFSEANHEKSVTVVEMEEKGNVSIRTIPLMPLRDLREIRGSYEEVTLRDFYKGKDFREDYLHIILTDEEDVPDGAAKLRLIYPNLMKLSYDNRRTQNQAQWEEMGPTEEKSPLAMLEEFYEKQNGQPMQETQRSFALGLMEEIWEDEPCDR